MVIKKMNRRSFLQIGLEREYELNGNYTKDDIYELMMLYRSMCFYSGLMYDKINSWLKVLIPIVFLCGFSMCGIVYKVLNKQSSTLFDILFMVTGFISVALFILIFMVNKSTEYMIGNFNEKAVSSEAREFSNKLVWDVSTLAEHNDRLDKKFTSIENIKEANSNE